MVRAELRAGPGVDALGPEARAVLEEQCRADLVGTSRILREVPYVAAALGDLPWAVLKGPVLDEVAYPRPGLRAYGDLDVLVAPHDLEAAIDALESAGAVLLDRNLVLARTQDRGELDLRLPGGTVLDLHWSLVNDACARRGLPHDVAAMLADRVPVDLAGTPAWRLASADAVVHLALHMLLGGADREVWAHDLRHAAALAAAEEADPVARAGPLAPVVAVALARAGVSLPLAPARPTTVWTVVLARFARVVPVGADRPHTGRRLYAATRPGTGASLRALVGGEVRARSRRPGPTKADLAHPDDSPAARRAFFDHVAAAR